GVRVGLVDIGQTDERVRVSAHSLSEVVVEATVQACILQHSAVDSSPRHLLQHELGRAGHRLQTGWEELQVQVFTVGGPLETAEPADSKINRSQAGCSVE